MLASLGQARDNERRFIADAAHELRTPVTALLGNAHFLARHGADEAVIADVLSDAQRLTRLVDDLLVLELQSAAGHRIAAAPQRVDLRDLAALVATRNARVRVEAQAPAQVDGDPEELRRALEKLVENALVHGPDHGPVTISLERRNGRVRAAVNDEGPGPDPAQRQRIFERFARAPDAAARPGSGLGLPIAEAIVRRHGGRIEVEGATFTIELPAAD
jgi:signal transduction histidine kinase